MSKFVFFVILGLSLSMANASLHSDEFETINVNGNLFELYTFSNLSDRISYSFIYDSQNLTTDPPRVQVSLISPTSDDIDDSLLVFVKHRSGVMSWQLPSIQKNGLRINEAAHTLCPALNVTNNRSEIVVNLSTYSKKNITFSISLNVSKDFDVLLNQQISFDVSLEKPVYYHHAFQQDIDMALINVTSDDDICMTLSIQNASHPVSDTLETVQYNGLRQTVSTNGGIIVSRNEYPLGLFLVFVVHSDDSVCTKKNPDPDPEALLFSSTRTKVVRFNIIKTVDFNLQLMSWVLIILIFVWILILTVVFYHNKKNINDMPNSITAEPSCSIESNPVNNQSDYESSDSSLEDDEHSTSQDKIMSRQCIRTKTCLFVSDLSMKNHRRLNSKSKLYLWNLITVAVFYSLPVVQLVFTFQKVLNDSGNQDLCYYNFLCSHSLIIGDVKFTDFNHLFSNIGYIFFGILFIVITYKRERAYVPNKHYGIPRHSGLYYSMGSALAIEGLMSACYHICPNHSNIQFDTSFMYIICMLCMIKIYQTRHPDINANSYFIFGMLAFVIILGLAGIMLDGLVFSIFFTVIHLTMSIWLSAHIYYMSAWKLDRKAPKRFYEYIKSSPNPCKPKYLNRMVLLSIGLLVNFGLATSHIINSKMYSNFSNYLLTLFMVNLMLYLIFYIVMKLISKEKINFWPLLYLVLAVLCWSAAIFFFTHRSSSWDLTAAQSRKFNTPCSYLELFDNHDMWHFVSALGLILSFMLLLTLDDDLANKPTATIPVF